MNKEFIPYDIALAMKELGFDEICLARYKGEVLTLNSFHTNSDFKTHNRFHEHKITAPLYQQAFRWFEDNYDDAITIRTYKMSNGVRWYDYSVNEFGGRSKSKEEAELTCLRKLIEIVKENL